MRRSRQGQPLWRKTSLKADVWGTELRASEYVVRSIKYGIRDLPIIPFTEGLELSEIPQTDEDKIFAREDLEMGCRNGIYEEMSHREAQEKKVEGKIRYITFVTLHACPFADVIIFNQFFVFSPSNRPLRNFGASKSVDR